MGGVIHIEFEPAGSSLRQYGERTTRRIQQAIQGTAPSVLVHSLPRQGVRVLEPRTEEAFQLRQVRDGIERFIRGRRHRPIPIEVRKLASFGTHTIYLSVGSDELSEEMEQLHTQLRNSGMDVGKHECCIHGIYLAEGLNEAAFAAAFECFESETYPRHITLDALCVRNSGFPLYHNRMAA